MGQGLGVFKPRMNRAQRPSLLYALGTWVFCFFHSTKIVLTVPSVVKNQYIKGSFVSFIQKKNCECWMGI